MNIPTSDPKPPQTCPAVGKVVVMGLYADVARWASDRHISPRDLYHIRGAHGAASLPRGVLVHRVGRWWLEYERESFPSTITSLDARDARYEDHP